MFVSYNAAVPRAAAFPIPQGRLLSEVLRSVPHCVVLPSVVPSPAVSPSSSPGELCVSASQVNSVRTHPLDHAFSVDQRSCSLACAKTPTLYMQISRVSHTLYTQCWTLNPEDALSVLNNHWCASLMTEIVPPHFL